MPELADWQQILQDYLQKGKESRERLAEETGISVRTLYRWAREGKRDHPQILEMVAKVMHGVQDQMLLAVREAFPKEFPENLDVPFSAGSLVLPNIEQYYYVRALEARAVMVPQSSFDTIYKETLRQMVAQLDRDQKGILAIVAQCVAPSFPGQKVKRLRIHRRGYGTGVWRLSQVQKEFSVAVGSLSGTAVATGSPAFWPSDMVNLTSIQYVKDYHLIKSCGAFPILYAGKVSGSVFLGSTVPDFFSPQKVDLITHYTYILALAFQEHEFYSHEQIDLFYALPSVDDQTDFFQHYNDLVRSLKERYPDAAPEEIDKMAGDDVRQRLGC